MRLKTSNCFRFSCLSNNIDRHAYSNLRSDWLKVFIKSNAHSWVHAENQVIQEVMVVSKQKGLHLSTCVQESHDTCKTDIREQELVRVKR